MSDLLLRAQTGKYAIPAIDVFNMESVNACFMAADKAKSPVILMSCGYELRQDHITYSDLVGIIRTIAKRYESVPYCIHLDHGTEDECYQALEGGFPSIMYDGSADSFNDNVKVTAALKKAAGANRCVEAEVGRVGGEEGKGVTPESTIIESDPTELVEFLDKTGTDTIAVSIGNIDGTHGFVKHAPRLNFELLETLHNSCDVPLVLHGASGIPENDIRRAVTLGICKVNYYTQIYNAFMASVKKDIALTAEECLGNATDAMVKEIVKLMDMCGSAGQVP